ncbi:hypothetical protein G4H13_40645 [Streptomyces rapamycinicus]|uniref:Helix-turn-helix domain-containing protein n=1 Tax=Streptomyces rhizosphaericus TaxID=114699 RepID=A0A6G4ASW4_9ACTN|nr:hypothetical protein [Streptomyces rhizosphaericus]
MNSCGRSAAAEDNTTDAFLTLGPHEWWLTDLARHTGIPYVTLYGWLRRGWATGRQLDEPRRPWIIRADPMEVERLQLLHQQSHGRRSRRAWLDHQQATVLTDRKGASGDDGETQL